MSGNIPVRVRWMIRRDLPAVLAICQQCDAEFQTEEDLYDLLRDRRTVGMVAEHTETGEVCGVMVYELSKSEMNLKLFAVSISHRWGGVCRQMDACLTEKLRVTHRERIYADVPAELVSLQVCLRSLGWRAMQILDTPDGEYYRFEKRAQTESPCVNRITGMLQKGG